MTDDDAADRLIESLALDFDDDAIAEFCEHLRAGLAEPIVISTAGDILKAERETRELMARLTAR